MYHDRYESPLVSRNASEEMLRLFSPRHKFSLWRRLWLELARCQRELGLTRVSDEAIRQMEAKLEDIDFDAAAAWEKRLRHDVMAHVHTFEEAAPAAKGIVHLGATSQYVVDNADLLIMRDALKLVARRLAAAIDALATFAVQWKDLPTLGYTHFQPAQLTTVGKRATLWMQDFGLDVEELAHRRESLRLRGCQGTTGTQAAFLDLFQGDHDKVRELERRVTAKLGFRDQFAVTGQTYPRKADSMVLDGLSGIAQSASKMAVDLRLLQHEGELLEPFESEQIGSSAMAYKRNPMRAERIGGLARYVISLQANGAHTAAGQWLERALDDSANRRLTLPEAFLATDAILILATNIAAGLEVREDVIRRHVTAQMPFMATERWLMLGVGAGGDRQELHEVIRRHSLAVAEAVSRGESNDLLERLAGDPAFARIPAAALRAELQPATYTGRAERQVGEFLTEYLHPLLARARPLAAEAEAAEIRV